jgi:hypothetical protein
MDSFFNLCAIHPSSFRFLSIYSSLYITHLPFFLFGPNFIIIFDGDKQAIFPYFPPFPSNNFCLIFSAGGGINEQ